MFTWILILKLSVLLFANFSIGWGFVLLENLAGILYVQCESWEANSIIYNLNVHWVKRVCTKGREVFYRCQPLFPNCFEQKTWTKYLRFCHWRGWPMLCCGNWYWCVELIALYQWNRTNVDSFTHARTICMRVSLQQTNFWATKALSMLNI